MVPAVGSRRTIQQETNTQWSLHMLASNYNMLPPLPLLEVHDPQAAEKRKWIKRAWMSYSLATSLSQKPNAVQVTTLLTMIGEEACQVFSTFSGWDHAGDGAKMESPSQVREILSHARISPSKYTNAHKSQGNENSTSHRQAEPQCTLWRN